VIPGLFGDPTQKAMRTALTGLQQRQQAIANNIANVDTPNYRAKGVAFEEALQAELAGPAKGPPRLQRLGLDATDARHIPVKPVVRGAVDARPVTFDTPDGTLRNDGNTVDVDREMSKLAETTILYNAMGQMTAGKLGTLRTAINEGRR
jgi:flagellar basal-body rod protein FlgB